MKRKTKETTMKSHHAEKISKRQQKQPDLVAMRSWSGQRSILRALVLVTWLDELFDPGDLLLWLESPSQKLDGLTPLDLLEKGKWNVFADLVDGMLTGAQT